MLKSIFTFVFLISFYLLYSQCECTDCPIHIASLSTETSIINISGSTNTQLGVNNQDLCRVCVNFHTDAIQEVNFILKAPNGSNIKLIQSDGINVNGNMDFDICFISCSAIPSPEPGHNPVFHTDDLWLKNSSNSGTYHPFSGCLEDLTGDVDGGWELEISDNIFGDHSDLFDWYLIFADDDGIGCAHSGECDNICEANAGNIIINSSPACPTEIINFSVENYNSTAQYEEYILIVNSNDEVIEFFQGNSYSFTYNYCGEFSVYSYNIEIAGTSIIPSIGDLITNYDCTNNCCDLESMLFSFEDNIPPHFTYIQEHPNYPNGDAFTKVYCIDEVLPTEQAQYDDNCIGSGFVDAIITDFTDPCTGGEYIRKWEISDSCNLDPVIVEQTIYIEPIPLGEYIDPPGNISVDCDEIPTSADNLFYSNGLTNSCQIEGEVSPELEENYSSCGGTLTITWLTTDDCDRDIEYVQTININPAPIPVFINPPNDTTIKCNDTPPLAPQILVSNNQSQQCLIEDFVDPISINNYDGCEGNITNIWNYIDECGRQIEYIQTITIEPTETPVFDSVQDTVFLACGVKDYTAQPLKYSNNSTGGCLVEGFVDGKIDSTSFDSKIIVTWTLNLNCINDTLISKQTILFKKAPFLTISPTDTTICQGDSFDLLDIIVIDTNDTNSFISFHNSFPPDSTNLISNTTVTSDDTTAFYILLTSKDSCTAYEQFTLNIEFPDKIAEDGQGIVCNGDSKYNLFDFLNNVVSTNGKWQDKRSPGVNIIDPYNVSFKNTDSGKYDFIYFNSSNNSCNSDTAKAVILVQDVFKIYVDSVKCAKDTIYYSVFISTQDSISLSINKGVLTNIENGIFEISKILLTDTLIVYGSDQRYQCENIIQITPPDCSCPFISPPISNGDMDVCLHELPITLSVNVPIDQTASWYSSPSGGSPLAAETSTFSPSDTIPGIYDFFVESISLDNENCVSNTRTLVRLVIHSKPNAQGTDFTTCQNLLIGNMDFFLSQLNDSITNKPNNISYYNSINDALFDINKLNDKLENPNGIEQHLFAKVIDQNGCFSIVPVSIKISPTPSASIFVNPSNILDCSVQKVIVSSKNEINTTYKWSIDNTPLLPDNLILDHEGEVMLIAIDTITGCQAIDSVQIKDLEAYPAVNIDEIDTLDCNTNSIVLDASSSQSGINYRYYWYYKRSSDPLFIDVNKINVETGGWYYLEIIDTSIGCTNIDSVYVEELIDWTITLQPELKYSSNKNNTIVASVNIDLDEIASIEWFPNENLSCFNCLNPEILTTGVSEYSVKITDIYGCSATAKIKIIFNDIDIFIPNIFSPNGDGINDYFVIELSEETAISNMEITIFNRWGEKVFFKDQLHPNQKSDFWDGTFKGKQLNPGVYIYTFKIKLVNGKDFSGVGDITIIK